MNKNLIFILIGGAAIYFYLKKKKIISNEFATQRWRVVVRKTSKVNVREEPNTTSPILMYLYTDQIITANEHDNDWLVFTMNNDPNGQKHYASKQYFTKYP